MLGCSQSGRKIPPKCQVDTSSVEMQSIILHNFYPRKQKGWNCSWKSYILQNYSVFSLPPPGNFKAHLKKRKEIFREDSNFSAHSKESDVIKPFTFPVLLPVSPGLQFTHHHLRKIWPLLLKDSGVSSHTNHLLWAKDPLTELVHLCKTSRFAEQREHYGTGNKRG